MEGQLLLVDKPREWTSFQAVNKLRWAFKKKHKLKKLKVGHAGTLDPLATGLLLIGTGKMTKKISEIQALEKIYTGIITLGATTPSYDLETAIDQSYSIDHIEENNKYSQKILKVKLISTLQFSLPLKKMGNGFTNTPERVKKQ